MIRLLAEAWVGLKGIYYLLMFRENWEQNFDFSLRGLWHSFAAILLVLPLIGLIMIGGYYAGSRDFFPVFMVSYTLSWLIFPIAAAIAVSVLGVRQNFIPWVVMHNWGVIPLYGLQALFWTLHVAGLADVDMLGLLFFAYGPIRLLIHWRIAYAALGVPTITAAMAAAVPVIASEILYEAVSQAFSTPVAG